MKYVATFLSLIGTLLFCGLAWSQQGVSGSLGVSVYPSEGQSSSQQAKDEGECYQWGRQTTGIDPANPLAGVQPQQAAQAPPPGASAARGAFRGAAGAGLIGNLAHEDAGEYAVAGALIGGIRGAKKSGEQQAQANAQTNAQTQAQAAERVGVFKNAFSVCMQGRKYAVR